MEKVIKNIPNIVTSIRLIMAVLAPITLLYNEYLLSLIFLIFSSTLSNTSKSYLLK